jgi:AcrR family transcriptional regulator
VVDAAARLFAEQGYVATSIDAVAEAAGVGRATVFATVGSKAALLKAAYDTSLVGDHEPVDLPTRARSRAIRAEEDPARYLERYAEVVTEICGRLAGVYEALRGAATADPKLNELWIEVRRQRRVGAAHVVGDLQSKGGLRPGLEDESAADLVWVHNDPGLYHQLVSERGWPPERFRSWLAGSLRRELLPPGRSRPPA